MNREPEGSGRLTLGLIGGVLAFACCAGPLLVGSLFTAGFFASLTGNDVVAGATVVVAATKAAGLWFSRRRARAACCEPVSNGKLEFHG